ncbi:MAG: hypothetical protein ACTSYI_15545 [Promethearchaeota archaeon]
MTFIQRNLHNESIPQPKDHKPRKKTFSINVSEETFHQLQSLRDTQAKEVGCRGSYNMAIRNLLSLKTTNDQLQQKYDSLHERQSHQLEQENRYLKELLIQSLSAPRNVPAYPPSYPTPYPNGQSLNTPPGSVLPAYLTQNAGNLGKPPTAPPSPPRKKISNYSPPNTENLRQDYQNEIHQIFNGELLKPSEIVQTTQPEHVDSGIQEIAEDFSVPRIDSISTAKRFQQQEASAMEA